MLRREFVKLLGGLIAVGKIDSFAICPKSDVVTFWAPVARADVPNSNGRIYSKDCLESAMSQFVKEKKELIGQIGYPKTSIYHFREASHVVKNLKLDQNYLCAEIEILNTPNGNILKSSIDGVCFRVHGVVTIHYDEQAKQGIISNFKLIAVNAIPINEAATL